MRGEICLRKMTAQRVRYSLSVLRALHGIGMEHSVLALRDVTLTAGHVSAGTLRFFSSPSIEFAKARNAFRKSLSERRKAWLQEAAEKHEASVREEANAQQKGRKLQQLHLEKTDDRRQDRKEVSAKIEHQREEQKAVKEAIREENLRREAGRQAVLATLQDERRRQMLEHSRHWVGNEVELEAAIDRAVDAVEPLFVSSKVVTRRTRQPGP